MVGGKLQVAITIDTNYKNLLSIEPKQKKCTVVYVEG